MKIAGRRILKEEFFGFIDFIMSPREINPMKNCRYSRKKFSSLMSFLRVFRKEREARRP